MRTTILYTGGGKTFSPVREEGMVESGYVRLIAEEGMGITDGVITATVIDTNDPKRWTDCEMPEEPETDTNTDEALTRYANELTGGNAENIQEATETLIKIVKEDK